MVWLLAAVLPFSGVFVHGPDASGLWGGAHRRAHGERPVGVRAGGVGGRERDAGDVTGAAAAAAAERSAALSAAGNCTGADSEIAAGARDDRNRPPPQTDGLAD